MAVETSTDASSITREEWIAARVSEFQGDPKMRDVALATILCDVMSLQQNVGAAFAFMSANPGMLKMAAGLFGGGKKVKENGA